MHLMWRPVSFDSHWSCEPSGLPTTTCGAVDTFLMCLDGQTADQSALHFPGQRFKTGPPGLRNGAIDLRSNSKLRGALQKSKVQILTHCPYIVVSRFWALRLPYPDRHKGFFAAHSLAQRLILQIRPHFGTCDDLGGCLTSCSLVRQLFELCNLIQGSTVGTD